MFNSPSTGSLRSLNECNVKPKRTSYGEMSTWFFMDNKEDSNKFKSPTELLFPPLDLKKTGLPSPREITSSPEIREFLMKNWANNRYDANKYSYITKEFHSERKGRSGAGGAWRNITQSFKEDGNRLLFVNGPNVVSQTTSEHSNRNRVIQTAAVHKGRELSKAQQEKMERERLGIQTRHGVDFGNWNIIR